MEANTALDENLELLSEWMKEHQIDSHNKPMKRRRRGVPESDVLVADGCVVAMCGTGTVRINDLFHTTFRPHGIANVVSLNMPAESIDIGTTSAMAVCCTPWAGMLLAVVTPDGRICVWSLATGSILFQCEISDLGHDELDENCCTCIAISDKVLLLAFKDWGIIGVQWQEYVDDIHPHFVIVSTAAREVTCMSFDVNEPHHVWVGTEHGPCVMDTSAPFGLRCLARTMQSPNLPWRRSDDDFLDSLHIHHAVSHNAPEECQVCASASKTVERMNTVVGVGPKVRFIESYDDRRAIVTDSDIYLVNFGTTSDGDLRTIERIPGRDGGVVALKLGADGCWILWNNNTVDHIGLRGEFQYNFEIEEEYCVDLSKVAHPETCMAICYDGLRLCTNGKTVIFFPE